MRGLRLRFTLRGLVVLVLAAGLMLGGLELYRRTRESRPPQPPWEPASPTMTANSWLWVNMDDVRAGGGPPRARWVTELPDGSYVSQDVTGTLPAGWKPPFRLKPPFTPWFRD